MKTLVRLINTNDFIMYEPIAIFVNHNVKISVLTNQLSHGSMVMLSLSWNFRGIALCCRDFDFAMQMISDW